MLKYLLPETGINWTNWLRWRTPCRTQRHEIFFSKYKKILINTNAEKLYNTCVNCPDKGVGALDGYHLWDGRDVQLGSHSGQQTLAEGGGAGDNMCVVELFVRGQDKGRQTLRQRAAERCVLCDQHLRQPRDLGKLRSYLSVTLKLIVKWNDKFLYYCGKVGTCKCTLTLNLLI